MLDQESRHNLCCTARQVKDFAASKDAQLLLDLLSEDFEKFMQPYFKKLPRFAASSAVLTCALALFFEECEEFEPLFLDSVQAFIEKILAQREGFELPVE